MSSVPFNITILSFSERMRALMRPVTALDIFDGMTKNFHPEGLYSTQIFGPVGTDVRSEKFAYIDLKVPVFHPIIYRRLVKMRSMYADIMSSKQYVVFDPDLGDFVKSNALEGNTGFAFFVENWQRIKFADTGSPQRQEAIKLIEKYKDRCMTDKLVVIPASYRDMELDSNGKQSSDEVNGLYYKAIATSNTIHDRVAQNTPEAYDRQRFTLQKTFIEIYETFEKVVEGKKSLLMNKWAARNIFNGTRNVITSMKTDSQYLGEEGSPGFNNTCVGMFQLLKGILPISKYLIRSGFLSTVFSSPTAPALLCRKSDLQSQRVQIKHSLFDEWMTGEGLEKIIDGFSEESIRHDPIEIMQDYYIGLLYRGPDDTFKLIHGIDELPEGREAKDCEPISLATLFYASVYFKANEYPILVTRYPVAGMGSIYSSFVFLESTIRYEKRYELDDNWQPFGESRVAYRFPTNSSFFNSMSPHDTKLVGLAADFDGDTSSGNILYTDEAIAENRRLMASRRFYIGHDGRFMSNIETDTVKFLMHNLTCGSD